jgi:ElaB/YqjD/DUF883 family membrane-anchored ribosome-binding protein
MTPRSSDDDPLDDGEIRQGRQPEDPDAVAARIQAIIDAAQSAAAGILKDAEVQARRRIESSRERAEGAASDRVDDIYSVTETLVEQARKVRERSGELVKALDDAIRHVEESEPGSEPRKTGRNDRSAPSAAELDVEPEQPDDAPGLRDRVTSSLRAERERLDEMMDRVSKTTERFSQRASEPVAEEPVERKAPKRVPRKARLLATRMAVAGSSREQISDKLREEHGVEDADALLDEILGPD